MKDSRLKRLTKAASYAVTILLIGICVFALVEYATGTQPFFVVGDNPSSMSPTLNYGDVAVIYRVPFSNLGPGSIIAFHDPRGDPGIIVHRIVSVLSCDETRCLATKGDNNVTNPTIDPWNVTQSDYIGEAVLVVPHIGYLSPAFWGFSGLTELMPISVVGIGAVLVGVLRQKSKEQKELG